MPPLFPHWINEHFSGPSGSLELVYLNIRILEKQTEIQVHNVLFMSSYDFDYEQ